MLPLVQGLGGSQRDVLGFVFVLESRNVKRKNNSNYFLVKSEILSTLVQCCIPMVLHPFARGCGKDTQKGIMDNGQLLLTAWGAHSQGFPDCVLGTQVV